MPSSPAPFAFLLPSTHHLRAPDLILIAAYLLAITAFGLHFRDRGPKGGASLRSYFLAGNTVPWWAISLSVVSAETSTLTIISVPGLAFVGNFGFLQLVIGYMLGRIVVAFLFLPRYIAGEMLTAYQLIDRRFGAVLHKVTAGLFLLTRAAAEGVRIFAVSIVVTVAIGTGDVLSIGIISALTLLYTFEGGLAAVIWTDVVQMVIYVGGTIVALISLGHHVPGGWTHIVTVASAAGKFHTFNFALNLTQSYTFWAGVLGGTFLTMASHGTDQLMVQRLLAARNLRESQLALLSSGVLIFLQFTFFLLIGAGLWVFYGGPANPHAAAAFRTTDYIFPTFITREMPTGIAGLLVAAILAAAMSNLSAALNSLSSTTVVDFYMRARPQASGRERNLVAKTSTALWAIVLFAIALVALHNGGKGHVVEIGLSIASVAYGCLLGVFLLGTLTRFATETGATLGMIVGFALNLWLWQGTFPVQLGPVTIPHIAFTWYVLIGAAVTFSVGALASKILPTHFGRRPRIAVVIALFLLTFPTGICVSSAHAQTKRNPAKARTNPHTPNPNSLPAKPLTVAPTPPADFSKISQLITAAIAQHQLPGAVVVIGHGGEIVFHHAYGDRKLAGEPGLDGKPSPAEPMTEDTVFDMASLTKIIATTTAIGQLYEAHKLDFDAPVERYLPAFNPTHDTQRREVTLRLLLTHFSGEPPDVDLKDTWGLAAPNKAEGLRRALTAPLAGTPGDKFVYSDINFILLGDIVETLTKERLQFYAEEHIFQPLGMLSTRYHAFEEVCGSHSSLGAAMLSDPTGPHEIDQICRASGWYISDIANTAPTAHDEEGTPATNPDFGRLLRGTVDDPTTRRMGGVAGHAGVFSTAHDMSLFAQALLDRYVGRPSKFPLERKTLIEMTVPQQPGHTPYQVGEAQRAEWAAEQSTQPQQQNNPLLAPNYPAIKSQSLRGFGWDIDSGYSKPRGRLFPLGSFGHTGFTGTSLWLDPQSDTYVLLLANSIHPRVGKPISTLRGEVATAAVQALGLYSSAAPAEEHPDATPAKSSQRTATESGSATDAVATVAQPPRPSRQSSSFHLAAYIPATAASTQTGIDHLEATHFAALARLQTTPDQPLRLGLLTNQTGLDSHGHRTVDILATDLPKAIPQAKLTTLFSPEHGIFGQQDTEHLHAETDPATGLPVTSLYGAHEADRRPAHRQLKDLSAVVIDLQDVGVRCYTYETVLGYFLEAAATEQSQFSHPLTVVVLDRPNPLTGTAVAGPTSDSGTESYINYMPLPLQHGLTFGELARYIVATKSLKVQLEVVPLTHWYRDEFFGATGLPWTPPSPNLHTLTAALLYPGTAMLEFTNLSVGRGSPLAFEAFGAPNPTAAHPQPRTDTQQPWFNATTVAADLNTQHLPGVRFAAISLPIAETPNHYPGHGTSIPAVHIILTDRTALNAPQVGVALLCTLHRLYPAQFGMDHVERLIANRETVAAIRRGDDPQTIAATWQASLRNFREARQPILLYR